MKKFMDYIKENALNALFFAGAVSSMSGSPYAFFKYTVPLMEETLKER